ncbi:RadC family protein [Pasteurella sp. PK-2025]|uniref:RadC family protein n=1 Tax=unclassified Pasteurella TaxID=2621516 RepID=UPI003C7290C7
MQSTPPLMPREKLLKFGANTLTDSELVAIFLRTGIKNCPVMQLSKHVLEHFGSLRGLLSASQQSFCQMKGIGITQFIQLQACIEMTKRYLQEELFFQQVFSDSHDVKFYLQAALQHKEREVFMVLFLDNQHRLIKQEEMFLGTVNAATVHPREIIKSALYCNAAALILAHNHPSGIATPSEADKLITQKIQTVAELVEIRILDHFIIGKGCYTSFAEAGLL